MAKPEAPKVSSNGAALEFPTDIWGLTSAVKLSMVQLAARIDGQPDKKALADATLAILMAHLEARYERDVNDRKPVKA